MRALIAAALFLIGLAAGCGGGASPSPIKVAPAVTTPASPLPSPGASGGYESGY